VLWKEDSDWVKKCTEYEVEGARPRGRPKMARLEVVQKDCQACKLSRDDAMVCHPSFNSMKNNDNYSPWTIEWHSLHHPTFSLVSRTATCDRRGHTETDRHRAIAYTMLSIGQMEEADKAWNV